MKGNVMLPILTNTTSLAAQRNLQNAQAALSNNLQKLSSGLRINTSGDDATGLPISDHIAKKAAEAVASGIRPTALSSILKTDLANEAVDSFRAGLVQNPTAALQAQAGQSPDRAMFLLR